MILSPKLIRQSSRHSCLRAARATIIRFGQKTSQALSAAFEAALGQLGLIERNDLATMAIANERPCAIALKRMSK